MVSADALYQTTFQKLWKLLERPQFSPVFDGDRIF